MHMAGYILMQNCEKQLLASCANVCLSDRKEQLGFHCKKFYAIWYLSFFFKISHENSSYIKIGKNIRYSTRRPVYICDHIALICSYNQKFFRKTLYRKSKHTFYVQWIPPRKSCRLWDNVEKYYRAEKVTDGNTTRRMRNVCRIPKSTNTHSE